MKKFQIFPCLSNRFRTCLFNCQKIVWHFGKSQNRKVVLKQTKKLPDFFPQPSATTIDPFQFAALQLWFGRIEGIAEPWCGILKKDKPGKVAQLLKHPGWVHNVLFFEKIMCFYRYVPLHTELLWYRKSRLFLKKLTSAPWIHGQSFCCPATETAWNFKSFLRCKDGEVIQDSWMHLSKAFALLLLSLLFDTWSFLSHLTKNLLFSFFVQKKNSIRSAAQLSTPVPATLLQPADVILIRLTQGQCRPEGFQVSQGYQDTLNIVRAHKLETKHNIHRLQASNSFCSQFLLLLAFGLSNLHLRVTDLSNWSTASHADKVTQKRITGPAT